MTHPFDPVLQHYEQAITGLEQLRMMLMAARQPDQLQLLDELQEHVEQAVWQARLGQRVTPGSVAATPYCRELPLGPNHSRYSDELRRGMLAVERSLMPSTRGAAPWNALLYGRNHITRGHARQSYECGFVMRLFQLLQEAKAAPSARAPGG